MRSSSSSSTGSSSWYYFFLYHLIFTSVVYSVILLQRLIHDRALTKSELKENILLSLALTIVILVVFIVVPKEVAFHQIIERVKRSNIFTVEKNHKDKVTDHISLRDETNIQIQMKPTDDRR